MLRTLSPDVFAKESTQTLEKANHLIASLRISKAYLVFCAVMSFLSSSLLVYSMHKLAKHGVKGLKMQVDLTEELMELAVCGGILVEIIWAFHLMPLRIFVRVKLLQLDICVFLTASLSAALASANLAEYAGYFTRGQEVPNDGTSSIQEGSSEEYLRGASAALFLFRFLLQPVRAILAMRNAWQLTQERRVAMEDIVLPEIRCSCDDFSPTALTQIGPHSKGDFAICSSEAEPV